VTLSQWFREEEMQQELLVVELKELHLLQEVLLKALLTVERELVDLPYEYVHRFRFHVHLQG
jgi:hypothetical protein